MKNLGAVVGASTLAVALIGYLVTSQVFIHNTNTRLDGIVLLQESRHKASTSTQEIYQARLDSTVVRLGITESDVRITTRVLSDLTDAIKEFSQNTKTLTSAVVRLDERVRNLESEK